MFHFGLQFGRFKQKRCLKTANLALCLQTPTKMLFFFLTSWWNLCFIGPHVWKRIKVGCCKAVSEDGTSNHPPLWHHNELVSTTANFLKKDGLFSFFLLDFNNRFRINNIVENHWQSGFLSNMWRSEPPNLSQTILHLMSDICSCVSLKYLNEFSVETSQFSTLRPSGDLLQSLF